MEIETLLAAAIQSSFLLGLIHGVNPCGHSWLVLAPFVTGEKRARKVVYLTCAFLGGTALACLLLGASLGSVSMLIPESAGAWVEGATSLVLLIIGAMLIYNPHLLHSHADHHDEHAHDDAGCSCSGHHHDHQRGSQKLGQKLRALVKHQKSLPLMLFVIGFVNMIVPCPTAAVMYGYALNSGSAAAATLVFGTYAFSTAIAVSAVIYLIYKITGSASSLQREWVEPLVMRLAGIVIVLFSAYGIYVLIQGQPS